MAAILTTFALISGTVKRSAIYLLQPTNRRIDVVIEASGAFYIVDSYVLVSNGGLRDSNPPYT